MRHVFWLRGNLRECLAQGPVRAITEVKRGRPIALFARSGRIFSREEVLAAFSNLTEHPTVVATNFEVHVIANGVALLTYTSAHLDQSRGLHGYTLRSSLWMHGSHGWQIRFHQGTPAVDPSR